MSIPRRLGRFARGFVSSLQEDERLRESLDEYLRTSRQRGETIKGAFGSAWRGASEEWRASEEERRFREDLYSGGEEEPPTGASRTYDPSDSRTSDSRTSGSRTSGSKTSGSGRRRDFSDFSSAFTGIKYPPEVLRAYERLGLIPGTSLSEVDRKRRELVKKFHPDRFSDPDKRVRAERVTADINASHDRIERHILKRR